MSTVSTEARPRAAIAEKTLRKDRWQQSPVLYVLLFATFVVYATIRAFANSAYYYRLHDYITPFYSPPLTNKNGNVANSAGIESWLNIPWPHWLSPAIIILIFPLGFRFTCYYYRKAYYRSVWQSPTACAVREPHRRYTGERRFPLILQNTHRFWFLFAFLLNICLTYDAVMGFRKWVPASGVEACSNLVAGSSVVKNASGMYVFQGSDNIYHLCANAAGSTGHWSFGIGVGTIVLVLNALFLWGYTLSCHACRHAVGGRLKHFSKHPTRYKMWTMVSKLNTRHQEWALVSMIWLMLADLYVMLASAGAFGTGGWI